MKTFQVCLMPNKARNFKYELYTHGYHFEAMECYSLILVVVFFDDDIDEQIINALLLAVQQGA